MPIRCILLSADLMLASQFQGAAERAGGSIEIAGSESALLKILGERHANHVVIDLTTPGLEIEQVVAKLRSLEEPPKILAFGPHVQGERLAAARDAGCDRVLSRGQFHAQMEEILRDL